MGCTLHRRVNLTFRITGIYGNVRTSMTTDLFKHTYQESEAFLRIGGRSPQTNIILCKSDL